MIHVVEYTERNDRTADARMERTPHWQREVLKAMKMDSLIPLVARVFNLFDNNRDGSANRVPLDISIKSRQVLERSSTHIHVPYGIGHRLPAEVSSSAVMYHMALDLTSQLRWAPVPSRVLWLQTSPLG
jgi:hypothetical protein